MHFVYVLTHVASTRHYVGKTNHVGKRWANHRSIARRVGRSDSAFYIHAALRKYGIDAFTWTVIEAFDHETDALETEAWWIAFLRSTVDGFGFNILHAGRGQTHTAETRRKIGNARRGHVPSAETRALLAASHRGVRASGATREKMRLAHVGTQASREAVARRAASKIGISVEEWLVGRDAGLRWCSRGRHWAEGSTVHQDACRPCATQRERERRAKRARSAA